MKNTNYTQLIKSKSSFIINAKDDLSTDFEFTNNNNNNNIYNFIFFKNLKLTKLLKELSLILKFYF